MAANRSCALPVPLGPSPAASKSGLAQYRQLVATAHTIARTVYHMLQDRVPYQDIGAAESNQRFRARMLQYS